MALSKQMHAAGMILAFHLEQICKQEIALCSAAHGCSSSIVRVSRKVDKVLMKKAMIAADEWARINLYQRQIGDQAGELRSSPGFPSLE
jgi:hypothetical protein